MKQIMGQNRIFEKKSSLTGLIYDYYLIYTCRDDPRDRLTAIKITSKRWAVLTPVSQWFIKMGNVTGFLIALDSKPK
jgi:hypothetical protein